MSASVGGQVSTISGYLEGDTCPRPAFPQRSRSAGSSPDPDVQARIRTGVQALYDSLADEITAGINAGELVAVDAALMATFLIGSWSGVLAAAANSATPDLPPDAARAAIAQAAAVLIDGLRAGAPSRK